MWPDGSSVGRIFLPPPHKTPALQPRRQLWCPLPLRERAAPEFQQTVMGEGLIPELIPLTPSPALPLWAAPSPRGRGPPNEKRPRGTLLKFSRPRGRSNSPPPILSA